MTIMLMTKLVFHSNHDHSILTEVGDTKNLMKINHVVKVYFFSYDIFRFNKKNIE